MYVEGMIDEGLLEFTQPQMDPVTADDDALRGMGLTVIDGGRV